MKARIKFIPVTIAFLFFLSACNISSQVAPSFDTAEEITPVSTAEAPQDEITQIYTAAQFGAPANGTGWFPLDENYSAQLAVIVDLSSVAIDGWSVVEGTDWLPQVELILTDGNTVSLYQDRERLFLCRNGQTYDCTEAVDFDLLCRTLESAQLAAVCADLPELTHLSVDVPDYPSRNREISLNAELSQFVWNTLIPDAWEIPDMYTAQDLARDWPDFVDLYREGLVIARVTSGEIQGTIHTVIFYQIGGEKDHTAYLFAPEVTYQTLFDWIQGQ